MRAVPRLAKTCCCRRTIAGLTMLLTLLGTAPARANDFSVLSDSIAAQSMDRSDHRLVEPLTSLARTHMRANQFDEAHQVLDRTIQILRFNEGLYTPAQYEVLQLIAENHRNRGNWSEANEDLEHLGWLYTSSFQGRVDEQLTRLIWLSDFHLAAIFEDQSANQVAHLKKATGINQLAVEIARQSDDAAPRLRMTLLYDLVLKYHMETQGIRGGGSSGYEIRVLTPNSASVQSRKTGVARRYRAGLDALEEIRTLLAAQPGGASAEARAMVDLYISDWNLLFNKSASAARDYEAIHQRMIAAGLPQDSVDELFARPAVLPATEFHSSLEAALSARHRQSADGIASLPLRLLEPSPRFPGYVKHPRAGADDRLSGKNWATLRVTSRIEPDARITRWLNGTLQTNPAGGEVLDVQALGEGSGQVMDAALAHLSQIRFRPVLQAGSAIPVDLTLDYIVPLPDTARFEMLRAAALLSLR